MQPFFAMNRAIYFACFLFAVGCTCSRSGNADGSVSGEPTACTGTETRCQGQELQTCSNGFFQTSDVCSNVCDRIAGCVDCLGTRGCRGNDAVMCENNTFGSVITACGAQGCNNGFCGQDSCGGQAGQFIYTVTENYNLLSFDPNTNTYASIGPIACNNAGNALPGWGNGGPATPFSMSVDREGNAWVLFTSGKIFKVSTTNAACLNEVPITVGANGFQLYGMGFVSDDIGSSAEKLFVWGGMVAGGGGGNLTNIRLGVLDPLSPSMIMQVASPAQVMISPELTGTGGAELFGFFPVANGTSYVAKINKQTGVLGTSGTERWTATGVTGPFVAWAFAQYAGNFYIFASTMNAGSTVNAVYKVDTTNNNTELVLTSSNVVVGAGVSTCVPFLPG